MHFKPYCSNEMSNSCIFKSRRCFGQCLSIVAVAFFFSFLLQIHDTTTATVSWVFVFVCKLRALTALVFIVRFLFFLLLFKVYLAYSSTHSQQGQILYVHYILSYRTTFVQSHVTVVATMQTEARSTGIFFYHYNGSSQFFFLSALFVYISIM